MSIITLKDQIAAKLKAIDDAKAELVTFAKQYGYPIDGELAERLGITEDNRNPKSLSQEEINRIVDQIL